jgi:hypothetical protein
MLRYCARPAFADERAVLKVASKAKQELVQSPLELIARVAGLLPPPRQYRHRCYGVLAPNAVLRSQVVPVQEVSKAKPFGDR